jgi:hypothetical protein
MVKKNVRKFKQQTKSLFTSSNTKMTKNVRGICRNFYSSEWMKNYLSPVIFCFAFECVNQIVETNTSRADRFKWEKTAHVCTDFCYYYLTKVQLDNTKEDGMGISN